MSKVLDIPLKEPSKSLTRYYQLTFKHRQHLGTKVFPLDGDMPQAIKRGQDHCRAMGYYFVIVRPFIVDLDHQEKMKSEDPAYSPE